MKRIIIFTNNDSILTFKTVANFNTINFNILNHANKIFGFNEESNLLVHYNGNNFNIYLINDEIEKEEFAACFENPNEYYILRHRKPEWGPFMYDSTIIEGMHEPDGPYYDKLVAILCNNDIKDKHKEIVDKLFSNADTKKEQADNLIAKLELLHEIYEGKDTSEISADNSLDEFSKKITGFKATVTKYNNEDNNHRAALIELRDALLADV